MARFGNFLLGVAAMAVTACGDPNVERVGFTDVAVEAGLDFSHRSGALPGGDPEDLPNIGAHLTGGAAIADFDGDGREDIYLPRIDAPDLLFRNGGDGRFEDVTLEVGLFDPGPSSAATAGDVDGDGDTDLYVSTYGGERNYLFINRLDESVGGFSEEAIERGVALSDLDVTRAFGAALGDYDLDGYLDMFVVDWGGRPEGTRSGSRLFRNRGAGEPGVFEDATEVAGVGVDAFRRRDPGAEWGSWSLTAAFSDLDGDGWPDLAVIGDFRTSRMFWNEGDGTFSDGTAAAGFDVIDSGMGLAVGDHDGDGMLDLFVSEISSVTQTEAILPGMGCRFFSNRGGRRFGRVARDLGLAQGGGWGWGATFLDVERDGVLELFLVNGFQLTTGYPPTPASEFIDDPARLWRLEEGRFVDVAPELGVASPHQGRAALVFDYDVDGDQDLLVVNHEQRMELFRNDLRTASGWLEVRLDGTRANRRGVGALVRVRVHDGGEYLTREITGGAVYSGSTPPTAYFGLGPGVEPVAEVRVRWPTPDHHEQVIRQVPRNGTVVIVEP